MGLTIVVTLRNYDETKLQSLALIARKVDCAICVIKSGGVLAVLFEPCISRSKYGLGCLQKTPHPPTVDIHSLASTSQV